MIHIVIPHYDTPELLAACIASLEEHTPQAHEFIVVDDCSDESAREALPSERFHRFVQLSERSGFTRAVNAGMELATGGDDIVLLNSDITVSPGWLTGLLAAVDLDPRIGIVMSQVRDAADTSFISCAGSTAPGQHRRGYEEDPALSALRIDADDYLPFACVLLRAEMVRELGPLDEQFAIYCSDNDYCYRAQAAVWKLCYQPASVVYHEGGGTTRTQLYDAQFRAWCQQDAARFRERWPEHAAKMERHSGPRELVPYHPVAGWVRDPRPLHRGGDDGAGA